MEMMCFFWLLLGLGKSAVYQVPALCMEGTAIVISPLLSLMDDQIQSLEKKGIVALTINSTLGVKAKRAAFEKLKEGTVKLLYIAPETLLKPELVEFINENVNISFIVIDEAHITSVWGMSFRPMYKEIGRVRQIFKTVPIVALTATADPLTKEDIVRVLKFNSDAKVYTHPVDRSNISYKVIAKTDEYSQTYNIVNKYSKDTCGIIYCMTRAKAEKMEKYLKSKGVTCEFFHAGMKVADKKQVQDAYMNKELNLIIATVAFGMGIDRSDVRYVINVDVCTSIEEFSQMSGRASRDGLAAESYILYSYVDVNKAQWLLRQSIKSPERLLINANKLKKMVNFCETFQCRRKKLLEYFGESPPKNCGNCDNCL